MPHPTSGHNSGVGELGSPPTHRKGAPSDMTSTLQHDSRRRTRFGRAQRMRGMPRGEPRRLIQGPIATVPTAFDDRFALDLGTMSALTAWWGKQGLVAGTTSIGNARAW